MLKLRQSAKLLFHAAGFRIVRDRPSNRFDAMEDTLGLLRTQGFVPSVVIDAGANVGQWASIAQEVYPDAKLHLIEPQPACASALEEIVDRNPLLTHHPFALTRPGICEVTMLGGGSTGAYVARQNEDDVDAQVLPSTTLDALMSDGIGQNDRVLLKLDLEGHEIDALMGASESLPLIEVILSETRFFEIQHNGRPTFPDLMMFLRERGFELYDFAALSPRTRDMRLRMGDAVFVHRSSPLLTDVSWE